MFASLCEYLLFLQGIDIFRQFLLVATAYGQHFLFCR